MKHRTISQVFYFFLTAFFFEQVVLAQTLFNSSAIFARESYGVTFTTTADTLFFVRSHGGKEKLQIWQSVKTEGVWSKPLPAFFADFNEIQNQPYVSPYGDAIYYSSKPDENSWADIYVVYKIEGVWGEPQRLSNSINSNANECQPAVSKNNTLYFTRSVSDNNIFRSTIVGNELSLALPLSPYINTIRNESDAYISPDEDYIIFTANRHDRLSETDLFVSFRKNDLWSYPQHFGIRINSEKSEFAPFVDQKNKLFYFSRLEIIGEQKKYKIYLIPLNELHLERLKKQAYFHLNVKPSLK